MDVELVQLSNASPLIIYTSPLWMSRIGAGPSIRTPLYIIYGR